MSNSLELSDEAFDPLALRAEIEAAFDLRFDDQDATSLHTMGDLHTAVLHHIGDPHGDRSLTELALARLQRALVTIAPNAGADTLLTALPARTPRALFATLAAGSGLRLPPLPIGPLTGLSGIISMALFVIIPVMLLADASPRLITVVGLVLLAAIWPLQRLDPLRYPAACVTLGDLARLVAAHNAATLAREGGRLDADSVWQALLDLVGTHTLTNVSDIDRDTTILRRAMA